MKNLINYFPIRTIQTSTCLEFDTIDDFCRFTKAHQLSDIFLLLNANNEPQHFGVLHNSVLFRHSTLGFKTLEDYVKAFQNSFTDADCFYEALQTGYQNYEDYKLVKEAGISCKQTFDKMKAAHFISGFADFEALLQSDTVLPAIPVFINPYELYNYATTNGFADYTQLQKSR